MRDRPMLLFLWPTLASRATLHLDPTLILDPMLILYAVAVTATPPVTKGSS